MTRPPNLRGLLLPPYDETFFGKFWKFSLFLMVLLQAASGTVPFPDGEAPDGTRYKTAYRCEGDSLAIFCDPGELIQVIRANYGRFSIAICNKHGYTDWSVNCMSTTTTRVLQRRCDSRRRCEIDVSSEVFGDPCPKTHKYLEIHYACVSENAGIGSVKGSTPKLPPWLLEGGASDLWSRNPQEEVYEEEISNSGSGSNGFSTNPLNPNPINPLLDLNEDEESTLNPPPPRKPILVALDVITPQKDAGPRIPITTPKFPSTTTTTTTATSSTTTSLAQGDASAKRSTTQGPDLTDPLLFSTHCKPVLSRKLQWNWTRTGEVAIQPCPEGSTGLARWSCQVGNRKNSGVQGQSEDGPQWKDPQPDMSDCKSKEMTDLETRVREQDPENVLASTLAHLTEKMTEAGQDENQKYEKSSMFGGDLEASVSVIKAIANRLRYLLQTQADSFYNKESFVQDIFQNILRSASNILSPDSRAAWLDLSRPQRLKLASALMKCLEEHAFLVADVIQSPETITEATKRTVTSISVIDTLSRSFLSENVTRFPLSFIANTTATSSNRVNQHLGPLKISKNELNYFDWTNSIELPKSAVSQLKGQPATAEGRQTLARIVFYSYKNIHQLLADADQQFTSSGVSHSDSLVVNSRVVSASIDGTVSSDTKLTQPIRVHLKHLQKTTGSLEEVSCAFWDIDDDSWSNEGCTPVFTNTSHTECECNHLTAFVLMSQPGGLSGSEVARSIGSGILFEGESTTSLEGDPASATTATHVLTLEIATYLVSTICLLILILILIQFRHQIRRGLKHTSNCSACCFRHSVKSSSRPDDVIDKSHHQLYASTAAVTTNLQQNGIHLEQALSTSNGSSSTGSTSSTGTCSSGSNDPNKRMMQSMVTIRPHQVQAKVTILQTESHLGSRSTNKLGLTSLIKSKLQSSKQNQSTPVADSTLCTLPRTTLQRKPAQSAPGLSTGRQVLTGTRSPQEAQQSTVTVSPYELTFTLTGCDTNDSSDDSQYASVANIASPTGHKRPLKPHPHYYYTTRLQPTRQSTLSEAQHCTGFNKNPYVSPQLSRLTSTLRSYGYNPVDVYSNSSACSSPQRTVLTNLSGSSTTISSAQLGSPHHLFQSRFHPRTEMTELDVQETSHVYCEIPAQRLLSSGSTGNYDNLRWNKGRQPFQQQTFLPKFSREDLTYAEDTTCDLQNVSDLSEDDTQRQPRATFSADSDFWMNGGLSGQQPLQKKLRKKQN